MSKPNIVILLCDQLRYDALACNGNKIVKTPNIDRLAQGGVNCSETVSSCPICAPFRATLITGRYAHSNGVVCNQYQLHDDQTFFAEALKEHDYRSAFIGKWHLGSGPYKQENRYGFDDLIAYNASHSYYNISYHHNEEGPFPIPEYAPRRETTLGLEWIDQHQSEYNDKPFAAIISWGPPHWTGSKGGERDYGDYPQEYNIYNPEDCELSPNVPPMLRDYAKKEFADYYGMVTSLDDQVGRVLDYLDEHNLSDNTIVAFTSDHGDHLSSHGYGKPGSVWLPPALRASKATPYEESARIPFLIRWPQQLPKMCDNRLLLNNVDFMPTLLGLAGIEVPADAQGTDFSQQLINNENEGTSAQYLQIVGTGWPDRADWVGLWRGVRNHRYTYARFAYPHQDRFLFDRHEDPDQLTNLVDDEQYAHVVEELEQELQKFINKTEDAFDSGKRLPGTGMLSLGQRLLPCHPRKHVAAGYLEALEQENKETIQS